MSGTHSYNIIKVQWNLQDTPRVQLGPEGLSVKVRKFSCFNLPNGGSRSQRPMNHKISHKFQDQTFTAKLITPPKSTYKLRLNGLCHIPGTFFWARSAKFRHVWKTFTQFLDVAMKKLNLLVSMVIVVVFQPNAI